MPIDRPAAERAISDFLRALGHDPSTSPELQGTPGRVTEAFADDLLSGYAVDVPSLLATGSEAQDGLVVLRGVAVSTVCPHHLLPSMGTATLAYVPGTRLFGLGTLAKLVDAFCRRLALQEEIGQNVVQALTQYGDTKGAFCSLELAHACLATHGERRPEARVVTTARAGTLPEAEIAALIRSENGP